MNYADQTPPKSFKIFETIFVLIAMLIFSAFAAAEKGWFKQPEIARAEQMQAEPAPKLSETEPPAVPTVWQLMRDDNQTAAEFCGARKGN